MYPLYTQIIKTQDMAFNDCQMPQGSYQLQSFLSSLNSCFIILGSHISRTFLPAVKCAGKEVFLQLILWFFIFSTVWCFTLFNCQIAINISTPAYIHFLQTENCWPSLSAILSYPIYVLYFLFSFKVSVLFVLFFPF